MHNIRSKGTLPEQKVMRDLKRRKIYFAKHVDSIIGKPDILFRRKRIYNAKNKFGILEK
jgi:G:T-mismatch repair DNA endonuclease (very short patch repair protein)